MTKQLLTVYSLLALACASTPAFGTTISFQTIPGGNVAGNPVDARATFTTSLDTISLKIENLLADPNDVKQVIYDLQFLVSSGQNVGTISSITAFERSIFGDGTYSDGPLLTRTGSQIDWDLNTDGATLHLDRLTFPGAKKHGIVGGPNGGTDEYDDANGSITGGTHNPFFGQTATFLLNVPGVTDESTIDSVTFSFNTSAGFNVPGQKITTIPEPTSCALAAITALASVGLACRRGRFGRQ